MSEYYRAYEERYRAVYAQGDFTWGHTAEDAQLAAVLEEWVREYGLAGKRVAEFACGEGAGGVLMCRMGCIYEGYDVAPTAVKIARKALGEFPGARVELMDMVKQALPEKTLDGALDISGLHMLVTDADRAAYISNVFRALKPGATALFWQESYRENAYDGAVESIEKWKEITGLDFDTPQRRGIGRSGREVMLRLLPARPRSREGYVAEFGAAGFDVIWVREIRDSDFMLSSAGILVRRPAKI